MKKLLSLILVLAMVIGVVPQLALSVESEETTPTDAFGNIENLRFDDHVDMSGKTVEIIDAGTPTSYQVGYGVKENAVPDTAVITLKGNTLIATGIGTATVRIDEQLYNVSVTAAPISLILLAGQSNMQGSEGDADQSIVCPDGMVYSTYGDRYTMNVNNATNFAPSALTGIGSTLNINGTTANISDWPIYLLNETGVGKAGPDSGFAYEWVKQTGEKVWIVNAAHGGSSITTWQKTGANYKEAIALFSACQETLRQEIAAGHYTLSHMGYFWCQGCSDAGQTAEWYVNKYLTMHNNLKSELAFSENLTFEFAGIIPILYGKSSYRAGIYSDKNTRSYYESFEQLTFNGPRVAQYWMTNNPDLPDIWNVCNIGESWVWMPDGTNGVSDYFNAHYENGRVDYITQVSQSESWHKPTSPAAVHDSIHYNQIGYNEVGRESARNALIMLGEIDTPDVETRVEFLSWDGYTTVNTITAGTIGTSNTLIVPKVYPVWKSKEITYNLSDGLSWNYYDLLADSPLTDGKLCVIGADVSVSILARKLSSYRWDLENGILVNTGKTENKITLMTGSTENGVFIDTQYKLEHPIALLHDQNWILEWKMTGPWYDDTTSSQKLFCQDGASATPGAMCLLIKGNENLITIGYYGTTTHVSYGLDLDNYGISMEDTHVYRLSNHINDDGTNTIYLFVDGVQIGSMTHYFTGASGTMGVESNYLSGKDFSFKYLGTPKYLLNNGVIEYISVVESGASHDIHFHYWSEWETVTSPDIDGPGKDNRICTGCGELETRIVESIWQTTNIADHWNELPENVCGNLNLWSALEHDPKYYVNSKGDWDYHSSKNVPSVTFAVTPGDKIFATSFGKAGENGHTSANGIRVTWFDINGVCKTTDPAGTYAEFITNGGYLIAPEGAIAINIPMWNNRDDNEVYILNSEHRYAGTTCVSCGAKHQNVSNYKGKVISILGDSISTFAGYIPVADGFNLTHLARYPQDNLLTDVNETWWMQVINKLDANLGINDSWRGSTVSGYPSVTTGVAGYLAAMSNLTQIQNLGSNGTPDVILFYGGTNDLVHTPKLGTFNPDIAPTKVDLTTLKWDNLADAYANTLMRLQYFYPNTQIIAILPTYTKSYYTNNKLAQGNALMADICEHYGITYVDLRYCGISTSDLPDGIHPNAIGMDYITDAVINALLTENQIQAGENTVCSVTHILERVTASHSYYKGVSLGKNFTETLRADNDITVTIFMNGEDITAEAYKNGTIYISEVTGDVLILASAKFSLGAHLQPLPDNVCGKFNLLEVLTPEDTYYTTSGWGDNASGTAYSVTISLSAGERLWATAFQAKTINGSGTFDGVRVTFFGENGVIESRLHTQVYKEFMANGYITAPEGTTAVNIPMWKGADKNELYILNRKHSYESTITHPSHTSGGYTTHTCTICGDSYNDSFTDPLPYLKGDINGDGKINNLDAARLMQYIAGWDVDCVEVALDVNGDEKINNLDAARLMQYIAGWDVEIH